MANPQLTAGIYARISYIRREDGTQSHPYGEVAASPAETAVLNLSPPSTAAPAPGLSSWPVC